MTDTSQSAKIHHDSFRCLNEPSWSQSIQTTIACTGRFRNYQDNGFAKPTGE